MISHYQTMISTTLWYLTNADLTTEELAEAVDELFHPTGIQKAFQQQRVRQPAPRPVPPQAHRQLRQPAPRPARRPRQRR